MKGVLLVNLGTPDAPTTPAVRRYLREFLGDPEVIDLPAAARWLLLNLVILPRRPARSAHAYRSVWTDRGSPLLLHSFDLVSELARRLEGQRVVQLGMRYGNPSLPAALGALQEKGVESLLVVPLYPQYATSTTRSTVERVKALVARTWPGVELQFLPPFFARPEFLDAFAAVARASVEKAEHVVFSFHGLPVRHVEKTDPTGAHCLKSESCCAKLGEVNKDCYRAQCFFTARALAERLGLPPERFSVGFQSRLSKRWLTPFTDVLLDDLASRGVRRVAVVCPAFVADCLETVEEIGIRAREAWKARGGEELWLAPSLNASPQWVDGLARCVLQL